MILVEGPVARDEEMVQNCLGGYLECHNSVLEELPLGCCVWK